MLQRVLIALTVLPRPALIVADEPTSALDVTVQKLILDMLSDLRRELDISLLLITHDLAIAAERADTLVVLKDGVVQESGPSRQVFAAPRTEYTRSLQADVPALNPDRYRRQRPAGGVPASRAAGVLPHVAGAGRRSRSGKSQSASPRPARRSSPSTAYPSPWPGGHHPRPRRGVRFRQEHRRPAPARTGAP